MTAVATHNGSPAPAPVRKGLTLTAVCIALFMVLLDNTVVNVALPSIQRALHASLPTLEWTVNAYTLGIAVFLVTGGRLGDIFGRRRMFVAGIVLFAAASAACAAAPDSGSLVAARAVQGIGGALLMPGTLSILSDAFPREERGRAIGIWSGVSGIALALGPLVGGALTEWISWRAIFLINVPISVAAVAVTLIAVRESRDERAERSMDALGVVTLSIALATVTLALIQANTWGWGSTRIVALFAASAVSGLAFLLVESRVKAPILPLDWLRSRRFSGPNTASAAIAFVMFGMFFFDTLYLQRVLGYSPIQAGVAFLPATVLAGVAAPISGMLVDRVGPRLPTVLGLALSAIAMWIVSQVSDTSGYGLMVPAFVLMGLAIGLVMPPTSTAIMNTVSDSQAGVASAVVSMTRMVGGVFGVALLGAVFQSVGRRHFEHAFTALKLPPPAHTDLLKGIGNPASLPVPPQLKPQLIGRITAAGHDAFVHALSSAMQLGAAVALAGTVAAWVLLRPERGSEAAAERERSRSGAGQVLSAVDR